MADFSLTAADAYFSQDTHVKFPVWDAYTQRQKEAGIATASRQLSQYLRGDIESESPAPTQYHEPDKAVFEQALFVLSGTIPDGDQAGPKWTSEQAAELESKDGLYVEALRWLPKREKPLRVVRG